MHSPFCRRSALQSSLSVSGELMIWEELWLKWAAPEIPLALSNKIVAFYDLVHCFAI
jgi:hypothetical protein